jgi:hypothetical protein
MDLAYAFISASLGVALNALWFYLDQWSWAKFGWYVVAVAVAPIAFMKRDTTPKVAPRKPFSLRSK